VWTPIAVVDDLELAAAMAELLLEDEAGVEVSVVSTDDVLHTLRAQDREHILERLNNRTLGEIERGRALQSAAAARLAEADRRTGHDRRSGRERRSIAERKPPGGERRSGRDRRSGRERRQVRAGTK
jgi:hypothetical protein